MPVYLGQDGFALELTEIIGRAMDAGGRARMMRTSRRMHDVFARLQYRSLNLSNDAAAKCISGIALSMKRGRNDQSSGRVILSNIVLQLTYHSTCYNDDVRILPALSALLPHLVFLQSIQLDIPNTSQALALASLRRHGILRTTPSLLGSLSLLSRNRINNSSAYTLPYLERIQLSSFDLLASLVKYRRIKSINLTCTLSRRKLDSAIECLFGQTYAQHITALKLKLAGDTELEDVLLAVSAACPGLACLSLSSTILLHEPEIKRVLLFLGSYPQVLPHLKFLILIETLWRPNADAASKRVRDWLQKSSERRSCFMSVIIKGSAYKKTGYDGSWSASSEELLLEAEKQSFEVFRIL